MSNKLTFCENCRKDVLYNEIKATLISSFKGEEYQYSGKHAVCPNCENEVYVGDINDFNLRQLYNAYREKHDIIPLEMILEIPQKYGIGKRPLSLLLGWGELTFSRYCEGYIPTKQYSDILKNINKDPKYYLSILESNKNLISSGSYEKSKRAIDELLSHSKSDRYKIDLVTDYLCSKFSDITSKTITITSFALQKMLYYIQGFCYAFNNEFIFSDDCEAWANGPVYKKIWAKFKYDFDCIETDKFDESQLPIEERLVIDSVIKYFGCYSGDTLKDFTHTEEPWINTRGELPINASSDNIIDKKLIADYFMEIKEKYKITTPSDICLYSRELFERLNN